MNLPVNCSTFCLHSMARFACLDVSIDGCIHVVEDVSALEDLEGLPTTPVSCRHGVVTTLDGFLYPGIWHQDNVIMPVLTMVKRRECLWVLYFLRLLSCNMLNLLTIV